jgi:DNA polymerase I-like protein with 3'-5' exonuclease and polymerase domains
LWLFYADLEQAESRIVAYDAECEQDIEDHISGDTHTGLCRDLFPDLPWPNGLADKRVAQTPLPWDSTHDYRSVAKIVRHGTNIGMQGASIGREIHSDKKTGDRLREQYFERYPENLRRQKEIMAQVATTGILVTPVGRKRQFFGRLWDAGTQREGLAQTQQSTIADVLNLALWRIWKELDLGVNVMNAPRASDPNRVWLLAQVHDAILGLIRPHDITTLLRIKELMTVPIKIRGRVCTIPVEIFLGRNFRHFNPSQPKTIGGLAGWKIEGDKLRVFNTREDLK